MTNLNRFKQFIKKDIDPKVYNNNVWEYTRVSSKEQFDNNSLSNQKKFNHEYAQKHELNIVDSFGGTYESASGDFTRAEFAKMFERIESAGKKPYAILVYKISRFSRTGTSGISALEKLVEGLGVHLIETSSGNSTETEEGKLRISEKLIEARRENINRLQVTKPGMISFLLLGNWLGNCPIGYDHYGPRVKDFERRKKNQELKINSKGKLLQKAFQWKRSGHSDAEILRRLKREGLTLYKQKISVIWRNPFYCGVIVNKMLEEPVRGNWSPIISEDEFWIIQDVLNKKGGYQHKNENPRFPLSNFISCAECGNKLTHYTNKKKNVDYYRCNYCNGMNINANTTVRSIRAGAHDSFKELLKSYLLDEKLIPLYKKQLEYTFKRMNEDRYTDKKSLDHRIASVDEKLKNIRRRFALGDIDKEMYEEFHKEVLDDKNDLLKALKEVSEDLSNLNPYIEKALQICQNIDKYWEKGDYYTRQRLQKLVFPSGIFLTKNKECYLTKNVNAIFNLIPSLSVKIAEIKKGLPSKYAKKSFIVAGVGLEPTTFGL